ncbi:MAG: hypothetical protein JO227_16850 [Acetobacteraceae bacterium]|nr:hypothetical protein [Acetobacteraceae bacterium]
MSATRAVNFIVEEIREAIPPVAFFLVTFNLVELTTQLILSEYFTRLANYMIATTTALIVGKAVLVAKALPFLRRFDAAPMIWPVLFKTSVYWGVVFVVRVLEQVIEYWVRSGMVRGVGHSIATEFSWDRFAAIQIWIFALFLLYTFLTELNTRLGGDELYRMLFTRQRREQVTVGVGPQGAGNRSMVRPSQRRKGGS